MIKELQHIVTSYLDPKSYKTLSDWKPLKYNKLKTILKNYESVIPELTKFEIVKSGIKLKLGLIDAFDRAYNDTDIFDQCKYTIHVPIKKWFHRRIKKLFLKYTDLNFIYSGQIAVPFGTLRDIGIVIKNKFKDKEHRISYPYNIITNYSDYKQIDSIIKLQQKYKELNTGGFIKYLPLFFNHDNITLEDIALAYEYVSCDIKEEEQEIYLNSQQYHENTLFKFNKYNPQLVRYEGGDPNLPQTFVQSLYYIFETVDQFFKIRDLYCKMITPEPDPNTLIFEY